MITPVEPIEVWAKRYDIELEENECPKCKKMFSPTVPIAFDDYRGVMWDDHGCGPKFTRTTVVPVSKEKIELWENFRNILA